MVVAFLVAVAFCLVVGLYFSKQILCVSNGPANGDVLVVLGGESIHRPHRAVELFQHGVAPRILVSGTGDCLEVRTYLVGKGIPEMQVELECASQNTKQNAEFSVRILREHKVKRAIIVTSWFHSRRALKCFRHFAPEIEFTSSPTSDDLPRSHWPNRYERGWVLNEYLKLGYYWIRYGIAPF